MYTITRPKSLFPLIRHLSYGATLWLARLPLTPNQITALSLAAGLGCAWSYLHSELTWQLLGALLLVICYVLDNCDGEIARLKNLHSNFGAHFDTFVDWIVHAAFFAALGYQVSIEKDQNLWLWLGLIAAFGATFNYILGYILIDEETGAKEETGAHGAELTTMPETLVEKALFILRELFRADFCFILLLLTAFGGAWLFLPLGAVGAQVYWVSAFHKAARDFHV